MRVLLDECVPRKFGRLLDGHDVQTASQASLAGIQNGRVLEAAQGRFDAFVTVDRNLSFQNPVKTLLSGLW